MLCLVTGQNTGNLEMTMTYEDKQIHFTLYGNNEIAKIVDENLKAKEKFTLKMINYGTELDFDNGDDFDANDLDIDNFSLEDKVYNAGDLIFADCDTEYNLMFLSSNQRYNAQKVGEIEKSSLEAFQSLLSMFNDEDSFDAIFSMKDDSEPIQAKFIPEVTYFVAAVAVVSGIILFAIIGFFYLFYYL